MGINFWTFTPWSFLYLRCLPGCLPHSRHKTKERIHHILPADSLLWWCFILKAKFFDRKDCEVLLCLLRHHALSWHPLLSSTDDLASLCMHVKWIQVLLCILLTILQWAVFLWPNSWFYFHMKKDNWNSQMPDNLKFYSSFGDFLKRSINNIRLQDPKHLLKAFTLYILNLWADYRVILCHWRMAGTAG